MFWNYQLFFVYFQTLIDIVDLINLLRKFEKVTPHLWETFKHIQLRIISHMQSLLITNWSTDYHVFVNSNVIHDLRLAQTSVFIIILL